MRNEIYLFPNINGAEYVILFKSKRGYYPLDEKGFNKKLMELTTSDQWTVVKESNDAILLKTKD